MTIFKKIIVFWVIIATLVLNNFAVLAIDQDTVLELPFQTPYDEIDGYSYPYQVPPPKILHISNLNSYQEQQQDQNSDKDNTPKLFYVVTPAEPNIYWKERTYDLYTGQGWLIQNADTTEVEENKISTKPPFSFDVYKYLPKGGYSLDLITPFTKQSFIDKKSLAMEPRADYELSINTYGDYTFSANVGVDTALKYRTEYYAPDFDIKKGGDLKDVPKEIIYAYTQLPEKFPEKLKDIAVDLAQKSGDNLADQVLNTYKFVQDNVEYDLKWGAGVTIPKDYDMALWTYENKKGICSHFATLFIALARAQGIPVRMAVGFAGGQVKDNSVFIYSSYAHAWVEIYLPNYGWVTIDPTKGSRGGEDGQQQQPDPNNPPEWSNGGNVRPDLKFTLDEELKKEKDKEKQDDSNNNNNGDNEQDGNNSDQSNGGQNGDSGGQQGGRQNGSQGGQGGSGSGQGSGGGSGGGQSGQGGSGGDSGFQGDINQLPNLDKWFSEDDIKKLDQEYEKWQNEQKLEDNSQFPDGNQPEGDKGNLPESDKNGDQEGDGLKNDIKNDLNKEENKDKSLAADIIRSVSSIGKNSQTNILLLILVIVLSVIGYIVYKKYSKTAVLRNKIEERIRSVNRFVDIVKVIEKVKALGASERYSEAAVYGYNELADYIAYVFDLINDPALTAREFEKLVKETSLLEPLNIIVEVFERAKYAKTNSKVDHDKLLTALYGIANTNKIKK